MSGEAGRGGQAEAAGAQHAYWGYTHYGVTYCGFTYHGHAYYGYGYCGHTYTMGVLATAILTMAGRGRQWRRMRTVAVPHLLTHAQGWGMGGAVA